MVIDMLGASSSSDALSFRTVALQHDTVLYARLRRVLSNDMLHYQNQGQTTFPGCIDNHIQEFSFVFFCSSIK